MLNGKTQPPVDSSSRHLQLFQAISKNRASLILAMVQYPLAQLTFRWYFCSQSNTCNQTGFISGWSIREGIAVAQEILHQCKKTKASDHLLKINFEKSYDMINWCCLKEAMQQMGFGSNQLRWIDSLLQSAEVNVITNGIIGNESRCSGRSD